MKRALMSCFCLGVLTIGAGVTPVLAQEAQPAGQESTEVFQVVRPGDTQLSCEAIRAEVEAYETEMADMQAAHNQLIAGMRPRSRVMPGQRAAAVATAVGGAAVPGAGLAIAAASNQTMMAGRAARYERGRDALGQSITDNQDRNARLTARIDHLLQISDRKRCPAIPIMGDASAD